MSFSSGDYIAIALGAAALLRWVVDAFFKKADTDEEKLNTLRLDFEIEKSANLEKSKNSAAALARIERSVNNLQAQFRALVTGSANRRLEIKDITDDN